ncbi:MAG: hypothetical protein HUJ26_10535 [Planctomycetaceae bacterium]|nr:hypothetical protein [Planctomycetaceae bacterium]
MMRNSAVVCLALGVIAGLSALNTIRTSHSIPSDPTARISYSIGVFLPTILLLAAGLYLAMKPKEGE